MWLDLTKEIDLDSESAERMKEIMYLSKDDTEKAQAEPMKKEKTLTSGVIHVSGLHIGPHC